MTDDLLRQCAASGQMDSRQIAAHERAGELRLTESDGGYECALPITYAGPEPKAPMSGEAKLLIVAVALTWLAVLALSVTDPRELASLWPILVARLAP